MITAADADIAARAVVTACGDPDPLLLADVLDGYTGFDMPFVVRSLGEMVAVLHQVVADRDGEDVATVRARMFALMAGAAVGEAAG